MQFSSRLPIAVHILTVIEYFKGEYKITSDFIASSVGVNPVIIRNVLGQLKSAGLVEVASGVGGASLKKTPAEISLLDVFHAVEEDKDLFRLHENPNPKCPVGRNINNILDDKLQLLKKNMERDMSNISLQTLLNSMSK